MRLRILWHIGAKSLLVLLCFVVLSLATVDDFSLLLGVAFLFVLLYAGMKLFHANIVFISSLVLLFFLFGYSLMFVLFLLSIALVFNLIYFVFVNKQQQIKPEILVVCFVVSSLPIFVFELNEISEILDKLLSIFLSAVFLYSIVSVLRILRLRKSVLTFFREEFAYLAFVIIGFGLGISSLTVAGFHIGLMLALVLIFLVSFFGKIAITLFLSLCLGVSFLLVGGGSEALAITVVTGLILCVLEGLNRWFKASLFYITVWVVGLYFDALGLQNGWFWLFLFVLVFAIASINTSVFETIRKRVDNKQKHNVFENGLLAGKTKVLKEQLISSAEVCFGMAQCFGGFGGICTTDEEAADAICMEVMNRICDSCVSKNICSSQKNKVLKTVLLETIHKGLVKGKVTVLDFPPNITATCKQLTVLISEFNRLTKKWLEYKEQENNNARLENINITHIHTVSKLLYGLASEIEEDIVTNEQLGEEIRSQLLYRNISAQALVVEKNAELEVFLYIRTEDANEEDLRKAVSGVLKRKMQVDFLKPHDRCHVLIKLTVAPNLDCVFGVASEKKHLTPETGDGHLVSKLGKDMFLAVVADGMGSGKEAANASGKVLELLENFFKAGFKANEAAMTINKIFAAQKVEVLSSVDAACINLKKEEVDFIKLGACPSFVLRQGEVIAVCGEDLPLGAVYASSAVSNKQTIRTNDMIVKISDGVYDAFTDIRFLVEFLKEQKTNNPKVLADSILGRAVELNRQIPRDDMTVLCIRIFKRH